MKTLRCSDAGFDCSEVIQANTEEEILERVAEHARTVHNIEITPEMAAQITMLIKDEPMRV